jgi:hypothetical protein
VPEFYAYRFDACAGELFNSHDVGPDAHWMDNARALSNIVPAAGPAGRAGTATEEIQEQVV